MSIDTDIGIDEAFIGEEVVANQIPDDDLQPAPSATKTTHLLDDSVADINRESSVPDADELDMLLHENS